MSVERLISVNGVTDQNSKEVTTTKHSNRSKSAEYQPVRVYSPRERNALLKAILRPGINWDRARPGVAKTLEQMHKSDSYDYLNINPVILAFLQIDQNVRVSKIIASNFEKTIPKSNAEKTSLVKV